ncbi:MAG: hypothetical protein LQ343_002971 [Gyalolechia ehrenbergii]|nr:MAG: hypothetical protein LQ343_002971 [Gyalolechia ehrenbergii]
MPPSPSLKRINPLSLHATNAYICPSCRARNVFNRIPRPRNSRLQAYPSTRRAASTITSVTAVNAKKDIPPAFQALHDALSGLQQEAAIYTNLSQLQLALRGLESENGVTRIALLGNHDGRATRRLARVLLADPLQPEPEWEKQITDIDDNDGRALLLRYAKRLELDQRHPLVRTLSLPSPTLQNHNIEILIQRVSTQPHESGLGARMYLTPGLEAPLSATGRFSTITYPVHKALIQARGLDGIQALLPPSSSKGSRVGDHMVTAVVDTPWTSLSADNQSTYSINPINLDRAEEAIRTFRKSLDNSFNYEHAWFESGMPRISAWLIDGTESLPAIVKPTNQRLIETLTANAEEAIDKEESEQLQEQASAVVPNSTRDLMNMYLAKWAEDAHTELRNHLDLAFTSKSWRKLTWWKLFWRVDDVTKRTQQK